MSRSPTKAFGAALLVLGPLMAGPAAAATSTADPCRAAAEHEERARNIPPGLVLAVAMAESGRWLPADRTTRPWPWTVTSGRESFFLPSKEAAVDKVRELEARGRSNIDVGCMQVNLGYHGHAFASLSEALEPTTNVAYGAGFLRSLRDETRSWARATARYHSGHPERGNAYRDRVYRLWYELRRQRPKAATPATRRRLPLVIDQTAGPLVEEAPRRLLVIPDQEQALAQLPAPAGGIAILRGRRLPPPPDPKSDQRAR